MGVGGSVHYIGSQDNKEIGKLSIGCGSSMPRGSSRMLDLFNDIMEGNYKWEKH